MAPPPCHEVRASRFARNGLVSEGCGDSVAHATHPRSQESRTRGTSGTIPARARLAIRILLVGSAWIASASRLDATPYYTVTSGGIDVTTGPESITNIQTGASYPFVTTTTPLTAADMQNLPGGTIMQGVEYPELMPYTMAVTSINSSGTVIGAIPTYGGSDPWDSVTLGYAVRSPDGQYSPFVPLMTQNGPLSPEEPIYLSQSNQILMFNVTTLTTSLFNVNTGSTTPITQLLPPAFLQQFPNSVFDGEGIDDRGDIILGVQGPQQGSLTTFYILTPPGLAPPTAAPEPSSLLIFGLIAGAWGLRTAVRRSREDVQGGGNLL